MVFGIKNLTNSNISIADIGVELSPNETRAISNQNIVNLINSEQLPGLIANDSIIFVKNIDSNTDFSKTDSLRLGARSLFNIPLIYFQNPSVTSLKLWIGSATVQSDGSWSLDISSAGFSTIEGLSAVAKKDTTNISEIPVVSVKTVSTTSITGWAVESKNTTVLLGGNIEGVEFSDTETTVYLQVLGS